MNPVIFYLAVINVFSFAAACWDKRQAAAHGSRVSENTLLLFAVLGGGAGLMLAFLAVRHKTKKLKFMAGVPLIMVLQAVAAVLLIIWIKKA